MAVPGSEEEQRDTAFIADSLFPPMQTSKKDVFFNYLFVSLVYYNSKLTGTAQKTDNI
jgi:hypothetical protein